MQKKDATIYRQAAIDAVCAVCGNDCDKSEFVYNAPQDEQVIICPEHYVLSTLPPAQPERKKGKWIVTSEFEDCIYAKCNQCKVTQVFYHNKPLTNFCPNCGADMRGE